MKKIILLYRFYCFNNKMVRLTKDPFKILSRYKVLEQYDMAGVSLPVEDEKDFYEKPVLIVYDKAPFFAYKEPNWTVFIGLRLTPEGLEWYETNSLTFTEHCFVNPKKIPDCIKEKILKLILQHKNDYFDQAFVWKNEADIKEKENLKFKYGVYFESKKHR